MGQNARQLMEEKYAIESVAKKMIRLYVWILLAKNVSGIPRLIFRKR
ncbi:MAG: hypothetical protein Q8N05_16975 [Bacteroidota bacterium]|nr:hypothetical protein [Bacteroidota bacterium]